MWTPRDFSYRKFARKYEQDGPKEAIRSSAEFATRKLFAPQILHRLIDRDLVRTLDRQELCEISDRLYVSKGDSNFEATTELGNSEFVASMDDGYVLPSTGLGLDRSGRLIQETVEPPQKQNNFVIETLIWHGFYDSTSLSKALLQGNTSTLNSHATERDIICPLCPRFTNYYHWLIETVPKLRYAREYETAFGVDVTYLVPSDAPSWLDQTLELLGVNDSDIEHATAPVYRAEQLVIPSFPESKPRNYRWIREDVLSNASPDREAIGAGNNVYISRANAIERRVTNEMEVVEMLSDYRFQPYSLEKNTLAENAVLFNEANAVAGPHGAGLADIIFCTDTTIFELFGSKVKQPYERLSKTLGLQYTPQVCEPESTDINVDIGELRAIVAEIEQKQPD